MRSRERVLTALRHQQPDRVPLDLGGTESSGLTAIACNQLRRHLNLPAGKTQIFDVWQQIAKIEDDLRQSLELDTIPLLLEPQRWKSGRLPDGSACEIPEHWNPVQEGSDWVVRDRQGHITSRMPQGGFYFESAYAPLAEVNEPSELSKFHDDIASFDWPAYADEGWDALTARAEKLYTQTDYAIVGNLQLHLLAAGQILRGYENFMMDLLANQELAHALLEQLVEAYIKRCDEYLARVGKYIQVVLVNDDLGTQKGPMLSPNCYKEMIFPYQKKLFQHIKRRTNAAILFHSCGAVSAFIPSLIEAGVDALNPVQVSAAGMDTEQLKKEFGKDITFWGGGCDTQRVLNSGSPREIEAEVKRRIETLGTQGGFVFTQVHNIQPDVPPANILAMYEAFRKYRGGGR